MTTYSTVIWRKARRSGQNGACVEVGVWRKALRSGQNGNCVEVKSAGAAILIRDSKYLRDPSNDPEAQPIISITVAQWSDFLEGCCRSVRSSHRARHHRARRRVGHAHVRRWRRPGLHAYRVVVLLGGSDRG